MSIQHVVAFKFPSSTPSIIEEVRTRFFALKDEVVNEQGVKVIVSIKGGKQDNWEGADKGLTHIFLLEFKNDKDRKWYINEDPAHQKFKTFVSPLLADAAVLDFTDGKW